MKVYSWILLIIVLTGSAYTATYAQVNSEVFKKYNTYYIIFGAGVSSLKAFPSDIYFDAGNNLQLGFMYEMAIHKEFSLVTGLEYEQNSYKFDGDIEFNQNGGITIIEAGPDKKFTGIRSKSISLPLHFRFYFFDNNTEDTRNLFLQGGLRITQSLDFLGEGKNGTYFFYRSNGNNESFSLSDYTNQTSFILELMVGTKGQFFKDFDLLNSSTMGFMYQMNPIFKDNSTKVFPLHFTWRFLF